MWFFRKTRRIEKPTSMGKMIPFDSQETEVIPRLTRDMPDTHLMPIVEDGPLGDGLVKASMEVIEGRLGVDDQNLADWRAELAATPGLEEVRRKAKAAAERLEDAQYLFALNLPDHLPEAFWAISRGDEKRVYRTPGGIKSALTQLGWWEGGDVWKGVVYWHKVTEDYADRPA